MKSKRAWQIRCNRVLNRYASGFPEDVRFKRTFPPLRLTIVERANPSLSARVLQPRAPLIEIALEFMNKLDAQCVEDGEIIRATFEIPGRSTLFRSALDAVTELATHFIVLHEVSHVLCGHLDSVQVPGRAMALAFDEASLGYTNLSTQGDGGQATLEEIHRAYFREMEADNTAIQWIMQGPLPAHLSRFLRLRFPHEAAVPDEVSIVDLDGGLRADAFRVLLCACWSVISVMERRRGRALKTPSEHPTSEARLVAAIFTLMEQYAELTTSRTDPDTGGRFHRLAQHHHAASLEFFDKVARSAFVQRAIAHYADEERQASELNAVIVLNGVKESLVDASTESLLNDELRAIERLRPSMARDLDAFRYFYNEAS